MKDTNKLILITIGLVVIFWIVEAYIEVFAFHYQGNFLYYLFSVDTPLIWYRLLVVILFIIFGFLSNLTIRERKEPGQKIKQSAKEWMLIFDSIMDLISIQDKNFKLIRVNKAYADALGMKPDELIGKTCYEMIHGTKEPWPTCPHKQALDTGKPVTEEFFEPKIGAYVDVSASPISDKKGEVIGTVHIIKDITERKEMEKRLQELLNTVTKAKVEWEMTFDYATEIILLVDKELNIIRCNKSFAEFTQKPIQELTGRKFTDFITSDAGLFEDRKIETRREIKTETGRWLYLSFHPIISKKGEFLHAIIIGTDITILKSTQQRLMESEEELEQLFISLVKAMVSTLDAKSPWTKGHSERVAYHAEQIAKEMGFKEDDLKSLQLAGLLHDIGKIGTYDYLLDKPDKLTDEEFEIVKEHPAQGAKIIEGIKQLKDIVSIIRHHHERVDGKGYPDGLKSEEIPIASRILHVADSFDSMTADRPYRSSPGIEYAIFELKKFSGLQFDPQVVYAFLKVLERDKKNFS